MTCFHVAPVCSGRHRSSKVRVDIKSWRTVFVLYSFRDDWTGLAAPGVSKGSRLPAINIQESALKVIGLWRSQKRHRPSDFNGFSESRHTRRQRHHARGFRLFNLTFGGQRPQPKLQSFCNNRSRVDRIDTYAIDHASISQGLGQIEQGAVDGATDGEICAASATAYPRDVDDAPPAGSQVGPCGAAASHRAIKLQRETVDPIIVGEAEKIAPLRCARIVHQ